MPISPQCNPETTSTPASQIGFIKFIVLPTYQMLGMLLPEVEQICVKQLNQNLEYWQEEAAKSKIGDGNENSGNHSVSAERFGPVSKMDSIVKASLVKPLAPTLVPTLIGGAKQPNKETVPGS